MLLSSSRLDTCLSKGSDQVLLYVVNFFLYFLGVLRETYHLVLHLLGLSNNGGHFVLHVFGVLYDAVDFDL